QISLFPNPVNSMVTLKIEVPAYGQVVDIGVYNLLGQRIDFFQLKQAISTQLEYDVSMLPTGMYLVKGTTGTSSAIKKLIVVK
ncbi:T9SS type A sorting domain-containing protein, partial [bacterium]|nr:T9SS type A sorting domain-containing protein [bacterium]